MIHISETELLNILTKAYDEGWYGSKDMGETVAKKIVEDMKSPEYVGSGGISNAKKIIEEAGIYYGNGENPGSGGYPAPSVEISAPSPAPGWTMQFSAGVPSEPVNFNHDHADHIQVEVNHYDDPSNIGWLPGEEGSPSFNPNQ